MSTKRRVKAQTCSCDVSVVLDLQTCLEQAGLRLTVSAAPNYTDIVTKLIMQTQPSGTSNISPIILSNQPVEHVDHFNYLGTITDQSLTFNENTESIFRSQSGIGFNQEVEELWH